MSRLAGIRLLSYSEISTALSCTAAWDMSYGGRLAGSALKPRTVARILGEGRAWGAAVAAWHSHGGTLLGASEAHTALHASLDADLRQMLEAGVPRQELLSQRFDMGLRLERMLEHYGQTSKPLENLTRLEEDIVVPVPSRAGVRGSNRYRFLARIDGYTVDLNENAWIVEFKKRDSLHGLELMELMRQYRWYAWAQSRLSGRRIVGVIIDERLNEIPKPPVIVQGKKKGTFRPSHKKDQLTTPEWYREQCALYDEEPDPDTLRALGARRWQQRTPIPFRADELDEAGLELTSAAKLIRDLDSGELYPIRNAKPANCNSCRFRRICAEPMDREFVDTLFTRHSPKRLRAEQEAGRSDGAIPLVDTAAALLDTEADPAGPVFEATQTKELLF